MKQKFFTISLLALAPFAACQTSKLDANQPSAGNVERSAPKIVAFSDDFPNVATKCAGFGNYRIWVTSHVNTDTSPTLTTDEKCP